MAEISMIRGRSVEEIRAIASATHDALVSSYEVPADDRFQVIKQYEEHELIFDFHFGGGPRTKDFVMVQVTAGRPRPIDVKQRFFRTLVDNLKSRAGIDPENVFIMLGNVEMSDLSLAGARPWQTPVFGARGA